MDQTRFLPNKKQDNRQVKKDQTMYTTTTHNTNQSNVGHTFQSFEITPKDGNLPKIITTDSLNTPLMLKNISKRWEADYYENLKYPRKSLRPNPAYLGDFLNVNSDVIYGVKKAGK